MRGLSNYTGINPSLLNVFNAALAVDASGNTAAANRAGTQLSPVPQAAATSTAAAPTLDVLNIVAAHADSLRLAMRDGDRLGDETGIATGEGSPVWGLWGQAFGGSASQGTRGPLDGSDANYGGLLLGADHAVGDNWRFGAVFGYNLTSIDDRGDSAGASARVNAYNLIGYASYVGDPWYVNLSAGGVLQTYSTHREIDFPGFAGLATGSFDGQQYVARAEVGYPLAVTSFTVTPAASLTYSHLHQDDYAESGGNGAALAVGSTQVNSVRSTLGVKLERGYDTTVGTFVPELRLQWIHEFDDAAQHTGASFLADTTGETAFTSVGSRPVGNLADISAGLTLLQAGNLSLTVRYELQTGSGFISQTGSLRLRQLF